MNQTPQDHLPEATDDTAWAELWRTRRPGDLDVAGDWASLQARILASPADSQVPSGVTSQRAGHKWVVRVGVAAGDAMPRQRHGRMKRSRWILPMALAASAALCTWVWMRWQTVDTVMLAQPRMASAISRMTHVEIAALRLSFAAAEAELGSIVIPPEMHASMATLDASAQAIEAALQRQPDAVYLRVGLQRIYEKRLRLMRNLAATPSPAAASVA